MGDYSAFRSLIEDTVPGVFMDSYNQKSADLKYARLRREVYEHTEILISMRLKLSIRVTDVTKQAILAWEKEWIPEEGYDVGGFDWRRWKDSFCNIPSRFEFALWLDNHLYGLALGKPSNGPSHVGIHVLEGFPSRKHKMKGYVLPVILLAGMAYAKVLKKQYLRLIDPVDGMISVYEKKFNFQFVKPRQGKPYCQRGVDDA